MTMHKHTSRISKALVLAAAVAMPATSLAAGFQLTEQSVNGLGRAFSGGAAMAENASTIFYNPAGLTQLSGSEMMFSASIISLGADFDKTTAVDATGQPLTGGEGGDVGKLGAVPTFYYAKQIDENMTFGLGVNAPFGLSTDHPIDWVGRYQAVYSHVSTLNINPSIGYKMNDNWSVGFGIDIMHMRVKLTNMVDYGAVCFGRVDPITCSALGLTPQSRDGYATIEGDNWGYGFNAGLLYHSENTNFGIHYRSKVDHELSGDATFTNAPTLFTAQGVFVPSDITADFETPESLSISVAHRLNDEWMISADATRTGWDTFQELRVNYASNQPDTVEEERWEDVWRYSVGVDWNYSPEWTFRAGYALDRTPVQDEYRTPRLPDEDRNWLSFGASYESSDSLSWNFGYAHLFLDDDIPLNKVGSQGDTLIGSYEAAADIYGIEMRYQF